MKYPLSGFIFLGLAIIAVGGIFINGLRPVEYIYNPPIVIDINQGESFSEISGKIYSAGLIRSKNIFKAYSILSGAAFKFSAGKYFFDKPVSVFELADILTSGPKEVSAVIFPGMTLKEIDDRLSGLGIINKGALTDYKNFDKFKKQYLFLADAKSLEGFIFPDTYNFHQGSNIDFVIDKIFENFNNKAGGLIFLNKDVNLLKLLTSASFLEKEVPDYEDMRLVAGIIEKRLKIGMPLQIDATLIYNKCSGRFLNCEPLKEIDYKTDSLYNTYLYTGLTPTPISNPGLKAIEAVLNKKDSAYLYYLSNPKNKKTIFSKNLDEHNKNRVKYLINR
ncbi:MAG: endolytic transglycosylase MltG [Patescibacteria group bacterium]